MLRLARKIFERSAPSTAGMRLFRQCAAKYVGLLANEGQGSSSDDGVFKFEYERQRHKGLEPVENLPGLRQGVHGGYRLAAAFVSFGCDVVVANQAGAEPLELCVAGPGALHLQVLRQSIRADV